MSLVCLRDVTRTVTLPDGEDLHILRGVNLDVAAGEHVSIVGRSGTGKSTMLNIIGLLDTPTSGSYELDGVDTTRLGEGRRARMRGEDFGFVFQQFNIFAARTAAENVEVPLLYAAGTQLLRRRSIALDMLERVGLADRADSYPGEMSGGEQQRIAIARALVRRPRVILADEPTGALDPDTGRVVMALLEEVARESNSALIVITHDMAVAARAAHWPEQCSCSSMQICSSRRGRGLRRSRRHPYAPLTIGSRTISRHSPMRHLRRRSSVHSCQRA